MKTMMMMMMMMVLKDMQQGRSTIKMAAAATFCVCMKFHSGKLISMEISVQLGSSTAWNMKCLIVDLIITMCSRK